jgi:DNA-binding LacI/PurR family transcriptional regulator
MSHTIRDVARKAKVGIGTVSRVLNHSPQVSEKTRKIVMDAIEELDFTPNPIARRLSTGKTLTIGVILPNLTRASYIERLRGVQETLSSTKYHLVLFSVGTVADRDDYLRTLPSSSMVDGLLIISISPTDKQVDRFKKSRLPIVLINADHPEVCSVGIDDVEGGKLATQYLIDLGHKRISYMGDHLETPYQPSTRFRHQGYLQAIRANNLAEQPEFQIFGESNRLNARQMAATLLTLEKPPTAIFASSDTQAIGILDKANELEIKVPDDLSVIGFDGLLDASYTNLTTIDQSLYQSGVEGVEMLLECLEEGSFKLRKKTLPLELIPRKTTSSINQNTERSNIRLET